MPWQSSSRKAAPSAKDPQRLVGTSEGDLGLFGLSSPSPPQSAGALHPSEAPSHAADAYKPASPPGKPPSDPPRPGSSSSPLAARRLSHRLGQHQSNGSSTSLLTNYYSAEENGGGASSSASATEDSPALQLAEIAPAPGSEHLSTEPSSVNSASGSRPGSASRRQAVSIEQETELMPLSSSPRTAARRPPNKSSRSRANVPPLEDRLSVGAGGPLAPPRSASVRSFGRRSSVGGGSNQGHGDLGSGLMPGIASQMPMVGSPVLPNPSPSIGGMANLEPSPRPSISSTVRSFPDRSASLPVSPSSTSIRVASPTNTQTDSVDAAASPGSSKEAPFKPGIKSRQATSPTSVAESGRDEPPLDREAMQRWVLSVGCVTFDLELGPDLEFLYPPLGISREERDNIAFSSFPDTSIFDDGYSVFSWRVREVPLDSSGSEPPTIRSLSSKVAEKQRSDVAHAAANALLDDKTPRPSINRTVSQATMRSRSPRDLGSAPSSPLSPAELYPKDAALKGLSKHASEANLQASSSSSGSSFRETFTSRLFSSHSQSGSHPGFSPGGSSRFGRHERKPSANSTSSATSADDDLDLATQAAQLQTGEIAAGLTKTSEGLLPRRNGTSTSSSYIYGYVFFRQKRDPTSRRGYFQKSVVILSHLPYVGLFSEVVSRLGPLYFEHGMTMFEAFANDVVGWPTPQPGSVLTLPLLGSILTAAIPFGQQAQNSPNADLYAAPPALSPPSSSSTNLRNAASTMTIRSRSRSQQQAGANVRELPSPLIGPGGPLLASLPPTSLLHTFSSIFPSLWLLWECILLADPILVIGPDPSSVSCAIWHLLDLVRPIPFAGDFRPYFHIHDYDFRTLVNKNKPQAGTLIGATNPFLATACAHWPNVVRVGRAAQGGKVGGGFKHGSVPPSSAGGANAAATAAAAAAAKKVGGGHTAGGGGPSHVPGFVTKRKRRVSKDRTLLKRLLDLPASSIDSATLEAKELTTATRRYFSDLTERFLAPLNRYVASLVPATFDLASPSEVPKIRPFSTADFLASLKTHGTPIPLRSRSLPTGAHVRVGLYCDFLKCPNFSLWLHSRVAAAEEEQRRRYIAALVHGDVTTYGNTKGEIETIDLYGRIVEEIRLVDVQLTAPTEPGPGSRWRTDRPAALSTSTSSRPRDPVASSFGISTPGSGWSTPTGSAAASSNHTTATSWPTTEKRLLDQKRRLMHQLDKLCETLPDDLKRSLKRPG